MEKLKNNSFFEVVTAYNGQQAVEKFKERNFSYCRNKKCENHKFNLILMDIQMPILDGIEAARKILELQKEFNS